MSLKKYSGSCHCGSISFSFETEEITEGLHCDCSYCERRQALMLPYTLSPEELHIEVKGDALSYYQFGNKVAKHYFCNQCGNYPFHETMRKPGHYRVNLGCLVGVDSFALERSIFRGKALLP